MSVLVILKAAGLSGTKAWVFWLSLDRLQEFLPIAKQMEAMSAACKAHRILRVVERKVWSLEFHGSNIDSTDSISSIDSIEFSLGRMWGAGVEILKGWRIVSNQGQQ